MANKKLTLTDIKNDNKKFTQKKRIDLSNGSHLFIYPHFSPTKIAELIKEILTDKQRAEEAELNFDDVNMGDWILFNVIYKFADLGIPSEIKKKIQAFHEIIEYDYFGEIISSFPEESIKKLQESVMKYRDNLDAFIKSELGDIENLLDDNNE